MDKNIEFFQYGLEHGQFPTLLYKYMNLDGVRKVLKNNTLKFSQRAEFNDVYECKGNKKIDYSQKEWEGYLMNQGLTAHDAAATAARIMANPSERASAIGDAVDNVTDRLGILCLTQDKDNILMWSHYADVHKGVCLEFNIGKDLPVFCFPKKVDYSNDYPDIDFFNNPYSATNVIYHKSKDWEYEKEYRVVEINAYNNEDKTGQDEIFTKKFNKEALTGIYFGCRCSEQAINEITKLAKDEGFTDTRFYIMEQDGTRYKLNARSLETI